MPVRHPLASIHIRNLALINLACAAGGELLHSGRVRFEGANSRQHQRILSVLAGTLTEWNPERDRSSSGCSCCREGGEVTVRQAPRPADADAAIRTIRRILGVA
jgi:hypothetical protein